MLPRAARLSRKEVKALRNAVRKATPSMVVYYRPRSQGFRAAVSVGTKVEKTAVRRNALRRKVFGALSMISTELPRVDALFVIRERSLLSLSGEELTSLIRSLLSSCP
jgi:ribonuclease P protein component